MRSARRRVQRLFGPVGFPKFASRRRRRSTWSSRPGRNFEAAIANVRERMSMLIQPPLDIFASRFDQQDWTTHVIARPTRRPAIVTATPGDVEHCVEIITRAFANDP